MNELLHFSIITRPLLLLFTEILNVERPDPI